MTHALFEPVTYTIIPLTVGHYTSPVLINPGSTWTDTVPSSRSSSVNSHTLAHRPVCPTHALTRSPVLLNADCTQLWVAQPSLFLHLLTVGGMIRPIPACAHGLEQGLLPLLPAPTPPTALGPRTPKHRWTHSLTLQCNIDKRKPSFIYKCNEHQRMY